MHEYGFDIKLNVVARVSAASEDEAREKLQSIAAVDLGLVDDNYQLTEASIDPSDAPHLFEVDGISQEG